MQKSRPRKIRTKTSGVIYEQPLLLHTIGDRHAQYVPEYEISKSVRLPCFNKGKVPSNSLFHNVGAPVELTALEEQAALKHTPRSGAHI